MKHLCPAWLGLLLCLCAPGVGAPRFPVTVVDARRVPVQMRQTPRRIVSLTPAITEMLFALGLGRSVVGDTVYCDYPPSARAIAKIGDLTTNYEKVVAIRPDLIVADGVGNRAAVARLSQLHLPLFVIRPTSFAAVEASLLQLGRVSGTDRQAHLVVAQMEAKSRSAALLAARDRGRRPRVLVVVDVHPLWTAGRGTFIDDVLARAGAVNVAGQLAGYATLSPETVLADPPDKILAEPHLQSAVRADRILGTLQAARANHFFFVSDNNLIVRPGPRLADGLLQVARALHPAAR